VAENTGCSFLSFLAGQQDHVTWAGCVVHDIIQPGFSFLVGAALAFSVSNRKASHQPEWQIWLHALARSFILIALGIFLRSLYSPITNFTFEDTLTQIGLGYFFLFMLSRTPAAVQWTALGIILVGYWLLFFLYPAPGPDFPWHDVLPKKEWDTWQHYTGLAAHWDKNSNAAWAFDTWFLNLFPRDKPFLFNGGGYATLSFIPTLGTMILGLRAGEVLRKDEIPAYDKITRLLIVGGLMIVAGLALDYFGICPNVKRIWTPSWTLFSGGICFLLTAGFYWAADVQGWAGWGWPLMVLGMNSIAAYLLDWLAPKWIGDNLQRHLGSGFLQTFGPAYEPLVKGTLVVLILWLMLYYFYRQKIFLRI
jgi:predicted acyltransferase